MRVLILGSSGYIGHYFHTYLQSLEIDVHAISRKHIDYTQPDLLQKLLEEQRPCFIINAAGFTGKPNVDTCESFRAETLFANTLFPMRLAEACEQLSIPWGHISSGCIFQGFKTDAENHISGYTEEDEPNFSFKHGPASFYSGTKALAEELLQKYNFTVRHYIWRLRVPFNHEDNSRNYISKLLRYEKLLDVRNSLSHINDYIKSCWHTYANELPSGIYNVTNHGSVTTREVVELIREVGTYRYKNGDKRAGREMLKAFHYFDSETQFMSAPGRAPRSSCVMDTTKAASYNLPLRSVEDALRDSLKNWIWE